MINRCPHERPSGVRERAGMSLEAPADDELGRFLDGTGEGNARKWSQRSTRSFRLMPVS